MGLNSFGDSATSWERIRGFYRELAAADAAFHDIAAIAEQVASSPFPAAGLYGLTSMHDLILGPSPQVLDNPHLIVKPNFSRREVTLVYQDWSRNPWTRVVPVAEAYAAIVRVLTKRARWYHAPSGAQK